VQGLALLKQGENRPFLYFHESLAFEVGLMAENVITSWTI
jgi:hypothetical protein